MANKSKYKNVIGPVLIGIAGLFSLPASHAQDMEISRGSVIAATCYTCHSNYGASAKGMPAIDGMPTGRIKKALMEFRDKTKASTVMGRHASGYTDEEITEVAAYLGKQAKKGE